MPCRSGRWIGAGGGAAHAGGTRPPGRGDCAGSRRGAGARGAGCGTAGRAPRQHRWRPAAAERSRNHKPPCAAHSSAAPPCGSCRGARCRGTARGARSAARGARGARCRTTGAAGGGPAPPGTPGCNAAAPAGPAFSVQPCTGPRQHVHPTPPTLAPSPCARFPCRRRSRQRWRVRRPLGWRQPQPRRRRRRLLRKRRRQSTPAWRACQVGPRAAREGRRVRLRPRCMVVCLRWPATGAVARGLRCGEQPVLVAPALLPAPLCRAAARAAEEEVEGLAGQQVEEEEEEEAAAAESALAAEEPAEPEPPAAPAEEAEEAEGETWLGLCRGGSRQGPLCVPCLGTTLRLPRVVRTRGWATRCCRAALPPALLPAAPLVPVQMGWRQRRPPRARRRLRQRSRSRLGSQRGRQVRRRAAGTARLRGAVLCGASWSPLHAG